MSAPREPMHTALESPRGIWWKPVHRSEKVNRPGFAGGSNL